jgi:hypothetical protein
LLKLSLGDARRGCVFRLPPGVGDVDIIILRNISRGEELTKQTEVLFIGWMMRGRRQPSGRPFEFSFSNLDVGTDKPRLFGVPKGLARLRETDFFVLSEECLKLTESAGLHKRQTLADDCLV